MTASAASGAAVVPPALADLVARSAAGDAQAMDRLLADVQPLARRFGQTVCGHPEDAEDASQEALVRTFRSVSRLREPGAFRAWLYRTVRNACLMSRRRRVGEPARLESLDAPPVPSALAPVDVPEQRKNPEQLLENARLRRQLRSALAALPVAFRVVIFLREMEGLSTRETAAVLGVSEDTVKTRLHRARTALQRQLPTTPAAERGSH